MTDAPFIDSIAGLSQQVGAARRQLANGQVADLTDLPARMHAIFQAVDQASAHDAKNALISLLSECDELVREIEAMHEQLGQELRSDRDRQKAFRAYKSPNGK